MAGMDEDLARGSAEEAAGRWEEALRRFESALSAGRRGGDASLEATALFRAGRLLASCDRPDPRRALRLLAGARRLLGRGARILPEGPGSAGSAGPEEISVAAARADLLLTDGSGAGFARLEKRLRTASRSASPRVRAEAFRILGIARLRRGQREEGIRLLGDAASLFERQEESRSLVAIVADIGRALVECGCEREALPFLRSALEDARVVPDPAVEARAGVWLATALVELGAFPEARALLDRHDPEDLDLHRDAVLARVALDLEEGLEGVRTAEIRRYEDPGDLEQALGLVHRAETRVARLLATTASPSRRASALHLLARAAWALASRTSDAGARARAERLSADAARECAAHAPRHVAQRAAALLAEVRSDAPAEGRMATVLEPARRRLRERFAPVRHADQHRQVEEIQNSLIGLLTPVPSRLEATGGLRPADTAYGDFWLGAETGGAFHLLAGDVAGHGIDSATFMMPLVTALRERLLSGEPLDPCVEAAARDGWLADLGVPQMFTSMVWVSLDLATGRLRAVRRGDVSLAVRNSAGRWRLLPVSGGALGYGSGRPGTAHEIDLSTGGLAVLFSDGVPDVQDPMLRQLGERGVLGILRRTDPRAPADEILRAVWSGIEEHAKSVRAEDDRTIAVLRVLPADPPRPGVSRRGATGRGATGPGRG
jgi:serine phosphatase RsbU (regulator of sigma subunit)/tetratricopeptide (TPR) repeat protein